MEIVMTEATSSSDTNGLEHDSMNVEGCNDSSVRTQINNSLNTFNVNTQLQHPSHNRIVEQHQGHYPLGLDTGYNQYNRRKRKEDHISLPSNSVEVIDVKSSAFINNNNNNNEANISCMEDCDSDIEYEKRKQIKSVHKGANENSHQRLDEKQQSSVRSRHAFIRFGTVKNSFQCKMICKEPFGNLVELLEDAWSEDPSDNNTVDRQLITAGTRYWCKWDGTVSAHTAQPIFEAMYPC